jgi:hypothetical protein
MVIALAASASIAFAQAQVQARVRVTAEQATIWRTGFSTPATVVRRGEELDVVARSGSWYEVILQPSGVVGSPTGFIAVSQVELISGQPPNRPLPARANPTAPPPPPRAAEPAIGVRAFGSLGYEFFNAHDSFAAVFGHGGGLLFGGGAEVRVHDIFVQGSVEYFKRTGQRVFEVNGDAFGLGIPDKVTITPFAATVGYRFHGHTVNPYFGGGAGIIHYSETSDFADPGENVDMNVTSYHVLGGVQWRAANGWLGTAFEVQYTHAPDAFSGGVADAFGEHNLGGIELRVKIELGK